MRAFLGFAFFLLACGPSKVSVEPKDVSRVDVRPASGQGLFCPGDAFQVELVARMKDGTVCSSTNRETGCRGKSDAIIDPSIVRVQAWPAEPVSDHAFTFVPDPNPLHTAGTGLGLQGWLESNGQKTEIAKNTLKPVYQCISHLVFEDHSSLGFGGNGRVGPNLTVSVTPLSTPWYANAALVRVDAPELGIVRYTISPSADRPVTIVAKGQDGAPGFPGMNGANGARGEDSHQTCGKGGRGQDGGPGGPGGPGGHGGPGGTIHVVLDVEAAQSLMARVRVLTPGGNGGPGGHGGFGGAGGAGGSAGPAGKNCSGSTGDSGHRGPDGPPGPHGLPGPDGPSPTYSSAPRATLFPSELSTLQQIEATPAPK